MIDRGMQQYGTCIPARLYISILPYFLFYMQQAGWGRRGRMDIMGMFVPDNLPHIAS
jgi:hypothetical protein